MFKNRERSHSRPYFQIKISGKTMTNMIGFISQKSVLAN